MSLADELKKLHDLHSSGAINREEWDQLKAGLLNNPPRPTLLRQESSNQSASSSELGVQTVAEIETKPEPAAGQPAASMGQAKPKLLSEQPQLSNPFQSAPVTPASTASSARNARAAENAKLGLFDTLGQMAGIPDRQPTADDDPRHATYHRRILVVAGCFAAVGAVLGLAISIIMASEAKSGKDIKLVIGMPVIMGGVAFMVGMAITCLFAPASFLTGPVGRPWMKLIGTKNITVARIVCFMVALSIAVMFVLIAWGT